MAKIISPAEGSAAVSSCRRALMETNYDKTDGREPHKPLYELIGQSNLNSREPVQLNSLPRETVAKAVRYSLQVLREKAPGQSVEVRVPPYGAAQILPGTTHRRGTPPAVVEMSPQTWLRLALGLLTWREACETAAVTASGNRADLSTLLPLAL